LSLRARAFHNDKPARKRRDRAITRIIQIAEGDARAAVAAVRRIGQIGDPLISRRAAAAPSVERAGSMLGISPSNGDKFARCTVELDRSFIDMHLTTHCSESLASFRRCQSPVRSPP